MIIVIFIAMVLLLVFAIWDLELKIPRIKKIRNPLFIYNRDKVVTNSIAKIMRDNNMKPFTMCLHKDCIQGVRKRLLKKMFHLKDEGHVSEHYDKYEPGYGEMHAITIEYIPA